MTNLKNIVVAVDFNDAVGELLGYAEGMAEKFGARIWVLHVSEPGADAGTKKPGAQYLKDFKSEELKEVHKTLQMYCETFLSEKVEKEACSSQAPPYRQLWKKHKNSKQIS